ncbi:MAG: hypothetical protein HYV09_22770 [Deltaproteobacteria bacterium]|nr:hypothetical protein [Deltaproteobacteria bacterium]
MKPLAAVLLVAALGACPRPPPPPAPPKPSGPPKRDVGPLLPLGWLDDRVGAGDAATRPDGEKDYALRVRLSGDVRALVLYASDATGESHGAEVWDTLTGSDRIPPSWHLPYADGKVTWALAVFDSSDKPLNAAVRLDRTTFADETVTLYAADTGRVRFVTGRTYTLLVQRSDGTVDRSTTTIL